MARAVGEQLNMTDNELVVPSGPLMGNKVELAPAGGIDSFRDIADRFMWRVFDLEPGDYLITDESSLADFVGVDGQELISLHEKVHRLYGLDVSDIEGGNLLQIFVRIAATDSD
jgi:hypothetical protein